MPWEAEVQTVAMTGAPMTLVDNNEIIDRKLEEWNNSVNKDGAFEETAGDADGEGCNCAAGDRPLAPVGLALGLLCLGLVRRRRA